MTNAEFDYHFVLVFARTLIESEQLFIQQIVGYLARSVLRIDEGCTFEWQYGGQTVQVDLDTTKTNSDDISAWFTEFWDKLNDFMANGSKPYSRAMRGKEKGFQLIPSIGFNPALLNSVFTDSIWPDDAPQPIGFTEDEVREQVASYMRDMFKTSNPTEVVVKNSQRYKRVHS